VTSDRSELDRNQNPDGDYHADLARRRASERAGRPKQFKLSDPTLCRDVSEWMDQGWSPKLIAQMLAKTYPGDLLRRVSHETIYQCLYVQTRGNLRADLHKQLSTKRPARKKRDSCDGPRNPIRGRVQDQRSSPRGEGPSRAGPLGISMVLSSRLRMLWRVGDPRSVVAQ
jgi:IS30 family transposase